MGIGLSRLPRPEKQEVAIKVREKLVARAEARIAAGLAPDPGYDEFIPELDASVTDLSAGMGGAQTADDARNKRLVLLDEADDDVDTHYRLVEAFLRIHARRRHGAHVAAAATLYKLTFPAGLEHVNDLIADENRECRKSLAVLRSAEWAATVTALALPPEWLVGWSEALDRSEKLDKEVADTRTKRKGHVDSARNAEVEWVELMTRLRKFVGSRTKRSDQALVLEGRELLAPLADVLDRAAAAEARRETARKAAEEAKKTEDARKAKEAEEARKAKEAEDAKKGGGKPD